jgi:capsular exopolysaccharide synthesis family protein
MSRIQQILTKADRDGTTAGLTWPKPDADARSVPPRIGPVRSDRPVERLRPDESPESPAERSLLVDGMPMAPLVGGDAAFPSRPVFGLTLDKQLVAALEPLSPAAEQYRALRTRIGQIEGTSPRHILAITSPGRGDGKTVTVLNLALSMAQEFDRRTLLIDADLRNAHMHSLLGIAREPGLADVLSGSTPLEEALVTLAGHRLQVLPAGTTHAQPSELLGSGAMRRLMEGLRRHFDRIVIDAASAQSAEAGALTPSVDGVLVVVRAGRTGRPAIERALAAIPEAKVMGMVLNDSRAVDGLAGG